VHLVDKYGLGDAFIARLPAEAPWRIGHYVRRLPEGYTETILSGRNMLRDPGVAAYYERVRLITQGPIWSRERFRTIARMNLGRYDRFVDDYGLVVVDASEVAAPRTDGEAWDASGTTDMTLRGATINWTPARQGRTLEISLSRNDYYELQVLQHGKVREVLNIDPAATTDGSLLTHRVPLSSDAAVDAIRILPSGGDSKFSFGHVRILP
jgi:arabinofuranosyltransferase